DIVGAADGDGAAAEDHVGHGNAGGRQQVVAAALELERRPGGAGEAATVRAPAGEAERPRRYQHHVAVVEGRLDGGDAGAGRPGQGAARQVVEGAAAEEAVVVAEVEDPLVVEDRPGDEGDRAARAAQRGRPGIDQGAPQGYPGAAEVNAPAGGG